MTERRKGMRRQCHTCAHLHLDNTGCAGCEKGAEIFAGSKKICVRYKHTDTPEMEGRSSCTSCHEVLPLDCFYTDNHFAEGKDCYCKACRKYINLSNVDRRERGTRMANNYKGNR